MLIRVAILGGLLLATGATVRAGQDDPSTTPKDSDKAKPPSNQGSKGTVPLRPGAMVFIDPVTHEIRQPTDSEIGALAAASAPIAPAAAAKPPVLIQRPDGAVGMKLGPESLSYMVATKSADGKVALDCVVGSKAAESKTAPADSKPSTQR